MEKFIRRIENAILVGALVTGVLALFANVVLRYVFDAGLVWAEEYSRFAIVWLTFVGMSVVIREGEHLCVTVIKEVFQNKAVQKLLDVSSVVLALAFSVFLVVYGTQVTVQIYGLQQLSPSLQLPMWWVYLAIPVGGVLSGYRFIRIGRALL